MRGQAPSPLLWPRDAVVWVRSGACPHAGTVPTANTAAYAFASSLSFDAAAMTCWATWAGTSS